MADDINKKIAIDLELTSNGAESVNKDLEKTIKNVAVLSKGIHSQIAAAQKSIASFKGLVSQIASYSGATVSLGNSLSTVVDYNKQLLGLSSQWNKYGVSITQVEDKMESMSKTLHLTRNEVMSLSSAFEKAFPYTTLAGSEKILKNIKNVVGANAQSISQMQGTLASIASMYPGMQSSIENLNEIDKERLTNQSRLLSMTGKISQEQYRTLRDYIQQNSQVSEADKERQKQAQEYADTIGKMRQFWEKIAIVIGKSVMPMMEKISNFLVNNQGLIEKIVSFTAKWIAPLLIAKSIFFSIGKTAVGIGSMLRSAVGTVGDFMSKGKGKMGAIGGVLSKIGGGDSAGAQKVFVVNMPSSLGGNGVLDSATDLMGMGGKGKGRFGRMWAGAKGLFKRGGLRRAAGGIKSLGGRAIRGASGLFKGAKWAKGAKLASIGGIAALGGELAFGGLQNHFESKGMKRAAGVAGLGKSAASIGGAALTGAAIGSVIPVVGTAVGAVAGGLIGGIMEFKNIVGSVKDIFTDWEKEKKLDSEARKAVTEGLKNELKARRDLEKSLKQQEVAFAMKRKSFLSDDPVDAVKRMRAAKAEEKKLQGFQRNMTGYIDEKGNKVKGKFDMDKIQDQRFMVEGLKKQVQDPSLPERQKKIAQEQLYIEAEKLSYLEESYELAYREINKALKANTAEQEQNMQLINEQNILMQKQDAFTEALTAKTSSSINKSMLLGRFELDSGKNRILQQNALAAIEDKKNKLIKQRAFLLEILKTAENDKDEAGILDAKSKLENIEQKINDTVQERIPMIRAEIEKAREILGLQSEIAGAAQSALGISIEQNTWLGKNYDIDSMLRETIKERRDEMEKIVDAQMRANNAMVLAGDNLFEQRKIQKEIIDLENQRKNVEMEIYNAVISTTNKYKAQLQLAQQNSQLAEQSVQLLDQFVTGLGASVQMRMQAISAAESELDIIRKTMIELESKKKEFGVDNAKIQSEINELKIKELSTTMKIADQAKALRDGWVDSVKAMQIGSGRISKIVVDQNKNLGVGMKYLDGFVRTYKSGAVGRAGEGMVGSAGSERFQANRYGSGGINIMGGRSSSPYATDFGPSIGDTNSIYQGLRNKDASAAINSIQGNIKRAKSGGSAMAGGTDAAAIMIAQGVGAGGSGVITDRGISGSSVSVPITMTFEINNNGDIKNIAGKVADVVEKRLSAQFGKNIQ